MTIYELGDMLDKDLVITRYANQGKRHSASLEGVEVKDGAVLRSAYGDGETPEEAIDDYVSKLQGRKIIINAYSDDRRELNVPKTLSK